MTTVEWMDKRGGFHATVMTDPTMTGRACDALRTGGNTVLKVTRPAPATFQFGANQ